MITLHRLRRLEAALRCRGYGPAIDWSESIAPPADAEAFAVEAIYVVINGGMRVTVAEIIFRRCMTALEASQSVTTVFGHPGKAAAIDTLWQGRHDFYSEYLEADDRMASLAALPWIGPVTVNQLAKNVNLADVSKPDVHLVRLARRDRTTVAKLCRRLSVAAGYRVATIDTILWRACESGLLNSKIYERYGWSAAISPAVTNEAFQPPNDEPFVTAAAEANTTTN